MIRKRSFGVTGDPADLVGRQAQVERVHDAAGGGNAEVALQVGVVVPAQGGHAVTLLQAQPAAPRPARGCGGSTRHSVASQRLVGQARDDSLPAKSWPARSSRWLSDSGTFIMVVSREGLLWGSKSTLRLGAPGNAECPSHGNPDARDCRAAARLVVEEGLEYGPPNVAPRAELGLPPAHGLPDND
jgi:hypothetical protein